MKVLIQRATVRIVQDQISRLASPFVPSPFIQLVPTVIDYIVFNNYYIRQKKCKLLVHPRKIAKTIPAVASVDIVNSDMIANVVDNIHDKSIHDFAHAFVIFVKYALMFA